MMTTMRQEHAPAEYGTSRECLEAAILAVRAAVRHYRAKGVPVEVVRRLILHRLRDELRDDFDAWSYETLMATAARTLDHALRS